MVLSRGAEEGNNPLLVHEVKTVNTNYAVVIIGRNEEQGVNKSVKSILNQSLKPEKIIFVNDGSTDKTRQIVESFKDVDVIDFGEEHESWVGSANLSKVINKGIFEIKNENINYIIIMGGDTVLPINYAEYILTQMTKHPEIVIASGRVDNEYCHVPRGSARVTNLKYWKKVGLGYKTRIGYEGYHVLKADSLGLAHKVFDINTVSTRRAGSNYSYEHWHNTGKAYKALGYAGLYVVGKAMLLASRKNIHAGFALLMGYHDNSDDFYEKEVRDYVRKQQMKLIKYKQKELLYRIFRR
jgi:glycosyltransferase involved in cell wall biosynthesis